MGSLKRFRLLAVVLVVLASFLAVALSFSVSGANRAGRAQPFEKKSRSHLNHAPFFPDPIDDPRDVTRACLKCHENAGREFMETSHWQWLGDDVTVPGHDAPMRIGKRNLMNNFCIGITGNEKACTKCHAGYGWENAGFDFNDPSNIDCLVCHEHSGAYIKTLGGMPAQDVDLRAAAQSVGTPERANCLTCHAYGGGGEAVKHGDIDATLDQPTPSDDIHMGRAGLICIDCHTTRNHRMRGRAFSVSIEDRMAVTCLDCHTREPHDDERINEHVSAVACQTCHIPAFARRHATKTQWDWSKAGDVTRQDDPHHYLKIKGEFLYDDNVTPTYAWFNGSMDRYIMGDTIDPAAVTDMNRPRGDRKDTTARIWPFKTHIANQPYDIRYRYLLVPTTGGDGGFWTTFDWQKSLELGEAATGMPYSGEFGFAQTRMFWAISHGVAPKDQALGCAECHSPDGRMDWVALGYDADPARAGGR